MKILIIKSMIFSFVMFFFLAVPELLCNDEPEGKGDRTCYGLFGGLSYAYSNSDISRSELMSYTIRQGVEYPIDLNDNYMNYYGLFIGGVFNYELGPAKRSSVNVKIYYSMLSGYYSSGINDRISSEILVGNLNNQEKLLEYTNENTFHFLGFESSYHINLFDTPLYLEIGNVFEILFSNNETGRIKINSSDPDIDFKEGMESVRFEDNKRTLVINDRELNKEEINIYRASINIGFGYQIEYDKMTLVPFMNYNFGITDIKKYSYGRLDIISVGVQLYLGSF